MINQQSFESKNRFESLSDNHKQVFQKNQLEDTITLKDIMKEIMSIKARQDAQEKIQSSNRSEEKNWRYPSTQDQEREWDSQQRNSPTQSQSQSQR